MGEIGVMSQQKWPCFILLDPCRLCTFCFGEDEVTNKGRECCCVDEPGERQGKGKRRKIKQKKGRIPFRFLIAASDQNREVRKVGNKEDRHPLSGSV